jgi:hypothetical protein
VLWIATFEVQEPVVARQVFEEISISPPSSVQLAPKESASVRLKSSLKFWPEGGAAATPAPIIGAVNLANSCPQQRDGSRRIKKRSFFMVGLLNG